jgi:hypothetical protein
MILSGMITWWKQQMQPALHRISTAPGTFDVTCAIFGFRAEPAKGGTQ